MNLITADYFSWVNPIWFEAASEMPVINEYTPCDKLYAHWA